MDAGAGAKGSRLKPLLHDRMRARCFGLDFVVLPWRPVAGPASVLVVAYGLQRQSGDRFHLRDLRAPHSYSCVHGSRSAEHTSELQSLMRISYAVFCLKNTKTHTRNNSITDS